MTDTATSATDSLARSTLTLAGVEIELFQGGNGPTLLFLHGGGGLQPNAPFLQQLSRRFRVVAPMHPGFGRSALPFWMDAVDDFAYIHLELIDRLKLDHILLVGASIGGWTAAEMATKTTAPFDRLILVGPVGIKVGPVDRLDIPDIFAMAQDKVEKLVWHAPEKWRFDPATKSDAELLAMARNRETLALVTWEPFMHNPKLKHRLHRIDRPTLILRGASDGLVSQDYVEAYAKLIPGARVATIAEAGHSPQIEQPERFVAEITGFAGR